MHRELTGNEDGKAICGKGDSFHHPWETHLWAAIRHVERNPVRVKMVTKAEDY
ncbi:hypothetical protein [Nitrosomonas sp. Nm33]|uniref:hypothetical protein n=1 Tax=Nitrosomonas sp. Nm33 TaxID=133724 RepID=UPI000898591C|nr:hypothetical protein [Nitrosomonas sp. Nm33]SDY65040.1 hypothetical protein SAMN05421755_103615 [Nitrosomonas sp. Nm33]